MARRPGQIVDEQKQLEKMEKMKSLANGYRDVEPIEDAEEAVSQQKLASLRDLVFLGRLTEKKEIGGFIFDIQSLTVAEQKSMMKRVMKADDEERLLGIRPIILSYAIRAVNGVPLDELCEDETITSVEDRRISVISGLQASLAEKLHKAYDNLIEEAEGDGAEGVKK